MAKLRQIINGVDPSTEKEEIVKEALSILINLAEEKVKGFIEEIKTDLLDGKLQDNSLKVPVTRVISQYEEYRAYVSENGDENYLLNNIIEGVNNIFSSSKDISGGISKILNSAFTAIMGAAEGEEQTKKIYFVVSEYPAIVRYDFALWNRTISSKGIFEHECLNPVTSACLLFWLEDMYSKFPTLSFNLFPSIWFTTSFGFDLNKNASATI